MVPTDSVFELEIELELVGCTLFLVAQLGAQRGVERVWIGPRPMRVGFQLLDPGLACFGTRLLFFLALQGGKGIVRIVGLGRVGLRVVDGMTTVLGRIPLLVLFSSAVGYDVLCMFGVGANFESGGAGVTLAAERPDGRGEVVTRLLFFRIEPPTLGNVCVA